MNELQLYVGAKIIKAEPMSRFEFLNNIKNQDVPTALDDEDGYYVLYPDGYESWSPKATFEEAYRLVSDGEIVLLNE